MNTKRKTAKKVVAKKAAKKALRPHPGVRASDIPAHRADELVAGGPVQNLNETSGEPATQSSYRAGFEDGKSHTHRNDPVLFAKRRHDQAKANWEVAVRQAEEANVALTKAQQDKEIRDLLVKRDNAEYVDAKAKYREVAGLPNTF